MAIKVDATYTEILKRKNRLCVDGFVREIKMNQIVPSEINDICMEYYHISNDRFDPQFKHYGLEIHSGTIVCPNSGNVSEGAFLSNIVSKGRHKWTFKIISMFKRSRSYYGYWYIGVYKMNIQDYNKADPSLFLNAVYNGSNREIAYALNLQCGELRGDVNIESLYYLSKEYQYESCQEGDVIEMYLDLDDYTLVYAINGKLDTKRTVNIEATRYRGAIAFASAKKGDQIECVQYEMY